uniref:Fructansucrase n=1 Tax=Weissella confusa TaxID=1583 RepID=D2WS87_WEICO|nr:fructansucrase [Weissella confusa]
MLRNNYFGETKTHYKLYKCGKNWAVMGISLFSLGLGMLVTSQPVSADVTATSTSSSAVRTDAISESSSSAAKAETTSASSSSAVKAETTSASSSSAVKAETTSASSSSAVEAETAAITTAGVANNDSQTSAEVTADSTSTSQVVTNNSNNQNNTAQPAGNSTSTTQSTNQANSQISNQGQLNQFATGFVNRAISEGANVDPNNFTQAQIDALNKLEKYSITKKNTDTTQFTYYQFQQTADKLAEVDPQYAIPYFKADQIQNLPAATAKDGQIGKVANMDIWDSWPVQDPTTGEISNWNGKQLVIAMMGTPNANSNHLYLLYNDYGGDNFAGWKNAGDIFAGYHGDKKTGLEIFDDQEWSGSAYPLNDGSIQLFYTHSNYETKTINHQNHQRIATANLKMKLNTDGTISIASVDNDHTLFEGKDNASANGTHYQTFDQWAHNVTMFDGHQEDFGGADNFAMRDPHIVKDSQGNRYLVFEASTGDDDYQSEDQIYDLRNYGGNAKFQLESLFNLINNDYSVMDKVTGKMIKIGRDMRVRASQANAAIGIIKLGGTENNPTVAEVYDPIISAVMVSDEIERPDIVKIGDTYYLFAASRLNRGTNDAAWRKANDKVGDNVVTLGWYSKDLTKGFKPLNGNGVVLTSTVPANWRTATYSYYAVPTRSTDPRFKNTVLITAYMTNRNRVADYRNKDGKAVLDPDFIQENNGEHNSTWAPSFLLRVNPDGTTRVLPYVTNQGVWDFNNATKLNTNIMTAKADEAYLPWEKGVPFDNGSILGSGQYWVDSMPSDPYIPTAPTAGTPGTTGTAGTPGTTGTAGTPGTAGTAGTPGTAGTAETAPTEPSKPTTPTNPVQAVQAAVTNFVDPQLPQTGATDQQHITLSGLLLLAMSSLLGLFRMTKRQRKE